MFQYTENKDQKGKPQVIFVQNSVHLAGAQKSLSRVLASTVLGDYEPILITSVSGWLTKFAESVGVTVITSKFPSSRSLKAKLYNNKQFAKSISLKIRLLLTEGRAIVVHANDHPDSIIALEISKALSAQSVITLRTPGMSKRDFFKYQCHQHDAIISVGDDLHNRASAWAPNCQHVLIYNGVTSDEFYPPRDVRPEPINRVLVLGSADERKGWQDLFSALSIIENSTAVKIFPEVVFLGDQFGVNPAERFQANSLKKFKVSFQQPVEDYAGVIRSFPLVIHPSRSESFGMSALETVAAGVPLLAASTGMIPQFIGNEDFLYPPGDIESLVKRISTLFDLDECEIAKRFKIEVRQNYIETHFTTQQTLNKLSEIYIDLMKDEFI